LRRPRLLDLFCGAGGAAMGYHQAGFEVVGVDIEPQPRYPFKFIRADALSYPCKGFDAIHASPPCQAHAITQNIWKNHAKHPDAIWATRFRLLLSGLPYVIENVPGAPLMEPVILCGEMFGLGVIRHRLFESNIPLARPMHLRHRGRASYGHRPTAGTVYMTVSGHYPDLPRAKLAMGINWMTRDELAQAIPPAYTEWIGHQLIAHLEALVA
jgi:DNA (cytosine-5)-methyltransferase 1